MRFFGWLVNEFLANLWDGFRIAMDYATRPFLNPKDTWKQLSAARPGVRAAILIALVASIVIGLGAITWWLGLDRYMSKGPRFFRMTWMGWLALIVILIIRLLISVLRQLRVLAPLQQSYPDIDAAIERGVQAAADEGIAIEQVPIFVVVGLTRAGEQEFRQCESVGGEVCFDDDQAPLHWYGNAEALWVTLPGVSVTCAQAELLAEARQRAAYKDSPYAAVANEFTSPARGSAAVGEPPHDSATGGIALASPPVAGSAALDVASVSTGQRNEARSRLRYLCETLQAVRYPVCTVNAVVLCVPFNEHVVAEEVAHDIRESVKIDMTALQQSLGVRCLSSVVFAGCNDNSALSTYIERLPPNSVAHRCGISFPQLVELNENDPDRMHEWLQRDFELQAMHLFKLAPGEVSNEFLFRFVDLVRTARPYFAGVLRSAYPQEVEYPFYFSGAYLAELSSVGDVPHPFFGGVLVKALKEHDELISWSPPALRDDAREKFVSRVLLGLAVVIMVGNTWLFWRIMMGD